MAIYLGDNGTIFEVATGVDLTLATNQTISVMAPGATTAVNWAATIASPAVHGILTYATQSSEINVVGIYTVIAVVNFGSGHFSGAPATFEVKALFS